ncbi:OLC1v1021062C1 [Oldenlandia corymbosa var. corymbosa]|uniref:OLC1v1021062C1 n=1 Tax=Oldenlandia corymbosa var. corymbosa TaxID=529605 RepID=A0AAV1BUV4_OLDCO|nr:OLC1v1021062C1 [Oldenlandia corymbosa var. corymbosa]
MPQTESRLSDILIPGREQVATRIADSSSSKHRASLQFYSINEMIDQFINFVIRPPRAEYNPNQYLWEKDFTIAGRQYKREDLELKNERGHTLQCSHYVPSPFPDGTRLPCVVYCHGNSGCRADANEAAVILLPSNITLFTLDFSGSGLSGGDHVSLGWHEKNDLKVVVSYLRTNSKISRIALWGRSMGAVTSLLYGAEDPSIAGMVLDSAFSNLFRLMMELVDVYKIRLPKFTIKVALQYMRRVIQKKANFDIMSLNCLQVAPTTYIPALFGHAKDDKFIQPHHSDLIFESYAGDKNIIKFDGDHNSSRPQFYYDSVSIFFYNVLHPPKLPAAHTNKADKYYDLGDLKVSADADEESLVIEETSRNGDDAAQLQGKLSGLNEESCSYTSSNRESWGRCSSLGSDNEPYFDCADLPKDQTKLNVVATPTRDVGHIPLKIPQDEETKKKGSTSKKSKGEKFEKLEALSHRLRLCILKSVKHKRHCSS